MRRALVRAICTILATAVVAGAGTAHAGTGRGQPETAVSVSNSHEASVSSICGYDFNYVQRMTVGGGASTWVPVQFVARPGHYQLLPTTDTCEGYRLYVLDTSCLCQLVAIET